MTYKLRPYQQQAVDISINYLRKNTHPSLLCLATGSGKSLICAEIARIMHDISKKKVLCLCPTAELVEQNYEKYLLTGNEASIYSASIGKSLRHNVVFATEGTWKNVAKEQGQYFSVIILDEAHRITPTIKKIIEDMKIGNPNIRVVGMTATPYRMNTGYIYEIDDNNNLVEKEDAIEPYFKKLLFRVTTQELINQGFLTPVRIGKIGAEQYDTSNLKTNSSGNFTQESLDEAFVGHGRKTAEIVADVINQANAMQARGVMFFAATVDHAHEIMASLPAYNSALVTGETSKSDRKKIIKDFKAMRIKYLVNVSVLTTGFDAPHCDVCAVLRRTESPSLLQQIIGRVLRLFNGKEYALYLDYAGNIETFFPEGDIFNPKITTVKSKESVKHSILCPECNNQNEVTLRPLPTGYTFNEFGYILDLAGDIFLHETEGKPFPAHFTRRCSHVEVKGHNVFQRCNYYWSYKECSECGHKNDLTARRCEACSHELINANDKLIADFKILKNDASQMQTDYVEFTKAVRLKDKRGIDYIQITIGTKHRIIRSAIYESRSKFYAVFDKNMMYCPRTVTYKKKSEKYFHIYDFERETDESVLQKSLSRC